MIQGIFGGFLRPLKKGLKPSHCMMARNRFLEDLFYRRRSNGGILRNDDGYDYENAKNNNIIG